MSADDERSAGTADAAGTGGTGGAASDRPPAPVRAVKKAYRTVTPPYRSRPDAEMSSIGFAIGLALLLLVLPLLPFILIVWAISKLAAIVEGRAGNS